MDAEAFVDECETIDINVFVGFYYRLGNLCHPLSDVVVLGNIMYMYVCVREYTHSYVVVLTY